MNEFERKIREKARETGIFKEIISVEQQPGSERERYPMVLLSVQFRDKWLSDEGAHFMMRFDRQRAADERWEPFEAFSEGFYCGEDDFKNALKPDNPEGRMGYLASTGVQSLGAPSPPQEPLMIAKPGPVGLPWEIELITHSGSRTEWTPPNDSCGAAGDKVEYPDFAQFPFVGFPVSTWIEDGSVGLGVSGIDFGDIPNLRRRISRERIRRAMEINDGGCAILECWRIAQAIEPTETVEVIEEILRDRGYL